MIRLFLTITFIGFWCNYLSAATYYVDYDGGNDANDGLSKITAWKHAPGDPAATSNPSTVGLVAGDVVLFKGGVVYRGTITMKYSGSTSAPITYKGDGWGTEKAILDGSEPITGWRKCTSVEEGGENWQHCYIAFVPAGVSAFTTHLAEEDEFLWLAQEPDQPDPFFFDAVNNFVSVPSTHQTTTSLIDTSRFNQPDSDYWDSSYLLLWVTPNVVQMRAILSYNPAEYKVTFESINNPDGYNRYSIYNSIHALDQPGEYFFDERSEPNGTHRILLWPRNEVDIINEKITLYSKPFGIDIRDNNYITTEGFVVRYYAGSDLTHAVGIGTVSVAYLTKTGITIRNNTITHNVHATGGYGGIYLSHCNNSKIQNNEIYENMKMKGIFCSDDSAVTVSGNTLRKVGGTCLSFYTGKDCRVFNNTISDGKGTHANGMNFYLGCERMLVYNNRVTDFNNTLTFQESKDLVFVNNIFDGANNIGYVVACWTGMTGPATFINNTIVGSNNHYSLYLNSGGPYATDPTGDSITYRMVNNILDGGGWESVNSYQYKRSHNLYVGLGWTQQWHPWMPSPGEVVDSSGSKYLAILNTDVFVNPSENDYHLKNNSRAINAGVDPESFFPHDIFPDFNWNIDMDGTTRPIGSGWDIGAYEYTVQVNSTITVSPTSLSFGNVINNTISGEQTYTLTGSNLSPASGNIIVTASTGYTVSKTSGSGYASSVTCAYTSNTLSTTIYVMFSPMAVQSYTGNITNAGGGATTQNVAVSGTGVSATTAALTINPTSLSFGNVIINTSKELTYTLTGLNLSPASDSLTITAPTGFTISTVSGSGFTSSKRIAYSGGTLSAKTIYVMFSPMAVQSYTGNITNAGGGATTQNVAVSGTGVSATTAALTINPTSLSFGSIIINTSKELTYTLTGLNLSPASDSLTITAPTGFTISTVSNSDFTSSKRIAYTNGILQPIPKIIYVGFSPADVQSYIGNITNEGGGAAAQNVSLSGIGVSATAPSLATNPTSLSFNDVTIKTLSPEKTYILTGSNLLPVSGNSTVTAPTGFQVSKTSGTDFDSSLTIAYSGGILAATTIYVRFFPTVVQSYTGSVVNTGGSAEAESVYVSGSGISASDVEESGISEIFKLGQNYPNPFNPSTQIQFVVPSDGHVRIRVYNCLGQIVATPFEGEAKSGHYQTVQIDGTSLRSGVYFYCIEHRGQRITKQMVLIK